MYQKQKKLALYAILGLSFFVFPLISNAYIDIQSDYSVNSGSYVRFKNAIASSTSGTVNGIQIYGKIDSANENLVICIVETANIYSGGGNCSNQGYTVIGSSTPFMFDSDFSLKTVYFENPVVFENTKQYWIFIGPYDGDGLPYFSLKGTNSENFSRSYYNNPPTQSAIDSMFYILGESDDFYNTTRIISLDPSNGSTTPTGNAVFINARAFIAEESSFWDTIKINLWTRDENSVLSRLVFTYQTDLYTTHFNGTATSTGIWQYSSTTMLADGNYTIQFSLGNSTLGGLIPNPFGGDTQVLTHQFVVGTSTFLGNLNQTIGQDIEDILQGKVATSTSVLLSHCKPWSEAGFDIVDCLSGLLIPDKGKMMELFEDFKLGIVYKFPWGYGFRFFALATGGSTTTPPTLGFSIPDDEFFPVSLRNKDFSLNPWSALSSTSPLTTADGFGQGNLMDTVMPYWNIIIYGMVVIGVTKRVLMYQSERTIESDIQYGKDREFKGRMGKIRRKMLNEDWRIRNRYSNKRNT